MTTKGKASLTDAQIDAIINRFIHEDVRADEAQSEINRLRRVKSRVTPRLLDLLINGDDHARTLAASLLSHLRDKSAIGPLRDILAGPDYTDDLKLTAFSVLRELGADVDESDLFENLQDPEAAVRRSMSRMLGMFSQPAQLTLFLESFSKQPAEMQVAFARSVGALADRRALHFLIPLLYSEDEDVTLAAIEAAAALKDPTAVQALEDIAEFNPSRIVRAEARKVAAHLTMRASVQGYPPPLESPSHLPVYASLISTVDGDGGQVVFVARERTDGELMVFDVMFNDHQGIKDAFGVEALTIEEFETNMVETLAGEGIELVEVSLAYIREIVGWAHRLTLETGHSLPLDYLVWRCLLEGEDTEPVEEHALPTLDPAMQPELLSNCHELLYLDEFESWFFNPEEIEKFTDAARALLKQQPRNLSKQLDVIVRDAIKTIVDDARRTLLCKRLDRQAWLAAQLYEDPEVALWCLAGARALDEGSPVAVEEHPLLRAMVIYSIENTLGEPLADYLAM